MASFVIFTLIFLGSFSLHINNTVKPHIIAEKTSLIGVFTIEMRPYKISDELLNICSNTFMH